MAEVRKLTKPDGTIAYALNGKLHNFNGPALILPDGTEQYYLNGDPYTLKEWKEIKKEQSGLPWFKKSAPKGSTHRF